MIRIAPVLVVLLSATTADAESYKFSSGDRQVALVELFTSEGCSSCPPADRWISELKESPDLWDKVVPVAFHVDYWDYIGWTDQFAKPQYGDRQRRYAKQGNANTVYTPGLFLNGQEWRGWYRGRTANSALNPATGDLRIEIEDATLRAEFAAANPDTDNLVLHVALLGFDIETRVKAGENNGKTLNHDFVVLGHQSLRMSPDRNSGVTASLKLASPSREAERYAIATWVSSSGSQVPIQATGGFLGDAASNGLANSGRFR